MKQTRKIQIGKKGLTPETQNQIKNIFENVNSLRISILKTATRDKEEKIKIADEIINTLGRNYKYRIIGYTIVINKFKKPVR